MCDGRLINAPFPLWCICRLTSPLCLRTTQPVWSLKTSVLSSAFGTHQVRIILRFLFLLAQSLIKLTLLHSPHVVNVCASAMSEVLYSWVDLWNLFTLPTAQSAWRRVTTVNEALSHSLFYKQCCCCLPRLYYLPILF